MTQDEIKAFWKLGSEVNKGNADALDIAEYENLKFKMLQMIQPSKDDNAPNEPMPLDIAFNSIVTCINEHFNVLNQAVTMKTLAEDEFNEKLNFISKALDAVKAKLFAQPS